MRRKKKQTEKLFEVPKADFWKALTWTCHICNENRPDSKISVLTKTVEALSSSAGGTVTENIRYCNDRPECFEAAKTFSHFHLEKEDNDHT